jgi:hypothetical protein
MAAPVLENPKTIPDISEERPSAAILVVPFLLTSAVVFLMLAAAVTSRGAIIEAGGRSPLKLLAVVAMAPVAAAAFGVAVVRWPQLVTAALLFACIYFNNSIELRWLPVGGFKLYPHDFLLGAAILTTAIRMRMNPQLRWTPTAVGKCMAAAIVFASLQSIRSVMLGNEFNASFGDLRRGYIYMIIYYLVLIEAGSPQGLRWVHRTFLVAALAITARGAYRLLLGRLFQMNWFDVFHAISHGDMVFVTFLSYYCLARTVYPSALPHGRASALSRSRVGWAVLFPVTLGLVVLGNFRAGWIGFAAAGLFVALLLPARQRRLLVAVSIPLFLVALMGLYATRNIRIGQSGETLGSEITSKFQRLLNYDIDPNIIWRKHSYQAALREWAPYPWLGAGLGHRLVFHSINAAGQQSVQFNHRAHNAVLWVGYTTGIVGLVIFFALHFTYFFGAMRWVARLGERPEAGVILAYLAFYIAFMVTSFFDVLLEESATAMALYAHMAIVRRIGEGSMKAGTEGTEDRSTKDEG